MTDSITIPRFLSSNRGPPPHALTSSDESRLHYSLLPVLERADNVRLPLGPWPDLQTIRSRARIRAQLYKELGLKNRSGRVDGDDLVPFFVGMPPEDAPGARARMGKRTGTESVPPGLADGDRNETEEGGREGTKLGTGEGRGIGTGSDGTGSGTPSTETGTGSGTGTARSLSFSSPTTTVSTRGSSGTSSRPGLGHGLGLNLASLSVREHAEEEESEPPRGRPTNPSYVSGSGWGYGYAQSEDHYDDHYSYHGSALDLDSAPPSPGTLERLMGTRPFDHTRPIGFLLPAVARAMVEDNARMERSHLRPCWKVVWAEDDVGTRLMGRLEGLTKEKEQGKERDESRRRLSRWRSGAGGAAGAVRAEVKEAVGAETKEEIPCAISFEEWMNEEGAETRKEHVDRLIRTWKESGKFRDVLSGWTNEQYTVYAAPDLSRLPPGGGVVNPLPSMAFTLEQAAVSLFSFLQFGVNMTAYTPTEPMRIWVARRPSSAHRWPLYLDNTVTLDLSTDDLHSPAVALLTTCVERQDWLPFPLPSSTAPSPSASPAPTPADATGPATGVGLGSGKLELELHPAGAVSYAFSGPISSTSPEGFVEVVVKYVYDLAVPPPASSTSATLSVPSPSPSPSSTPSGASPSPSSDSDSETSRLGLPPLHPPGSYALMEVDEVIASLKRGEFTPDAGMAMVDFLVRHGKVRPEGDARYWEVTSRLRNGFGGAVVVP